MAATAANSAMRLMMFLLVQIRVLFAKLTSLSQPPVLGAEKLQERPKSARIAYLCGRVSHARNRAVALSHLPSFQDLRASSRRGCQEEAGLFSPFHRFEFLRPLLAST